MFVFEILETAVSTRNAFLKIHFYSHDLTFSGVKT